MGPLLDLLHRGLDGKVCLSSQLPLPRPILPHPSACILGPAHPIMLLLLQAMDGFFAGLAAAEILFFLSELVLRNVAHPPQKWYQKCYVLLDVLNILSLGMDLQFHSWQWEDTAMGLSNWLYLQTSRASFRAGTFRHQGLAAFQSRVGACYAYGFLMCRACVCSQRGAPAVDAAYAAAGGVFDAVHARQGQPQRADQRGEHGADHGTTTHRAAHHTSTYARPNHALERVPVRHEAG